MKKQSLLVVALLAVLAALPATAQDAVGNGDYSEIGKLKNPVNDATDMASSLRGLGFQVKLLTDAVIRLGNDLAQEADSLGFFYYAGHGVQSGGINYLIPADARIVVVLDACRDNPFSWGRSGAGRGLTVVGNQPPGSLIAYATGAGSVAQDGTGLNGVFTAELLKNLATSGLEIGEVFKRTGAGVQAATAGKQNPVVYNQFFGNAYLAGQAAAGTAGTPAASPAPSKPRMTMAKTYGVVTVTARTAGTLFLDGGELGPLGAGASARLDDVETGDRVLEMRYPAGQSERTTVTVSKDGGALAAFS